MLTLLWWIVVGLIAGWATGRIMGSGKGFIGDVLLGIAGAIIGGWIMRAVGFAGRGGMFYTILVAIGGAIVLTWLFRLVAGSRGRGSGRGGRGTGESGESEFRKAA